MEQLTFLPFGFSSLGLVVSQRSGIIDALKIGDLDLNQGCGCDPPAMTRLGASPNFNTPTTQRGIGALPLFSACASRFVDRTKLCPLGKEVVLARLPLLAPNEQSFILLAILPRPAL
jgi:hypothetical protein